MSKKFSLKDELFNATKVHKIATEIKNIYPQFQLKEFEKAVVTEFPNLELKERIYHIRDSLHHFLPFSYQDSCNILLQSLPKELDPSKRDDNFGDFIYAPYSEFIAKYGCDEKNLDFSLDALRTITKRFSVEFSIRKFINIFPSQTMKTLERCAISSNYHERRLASEGSRPKLPWAKKLTLDYHLPIALLNQLYSDSTRYVTRSVANHLNDIAKIDASLVIQTLKRWQEEKKQSPKEMQFILNHALRTLIKQGDNEALALLGYRRNPKIEVFNFKINNNKIKIGEYLEFSFKIEAQEDEALMVDYIVHFQTKSGKTSPKVHKIKKLNIKKNSFVKLNKKHPFRGNMSTRKFYEGEHKIELQINGKVHTSRTFFLKI